jgi:CheY-like chemotaxis protein
MPDPQHSTNRTLVSRKLSVLIIEDSEEDAEQNVQYLKKAGYEVFSRRVETANEMRSALEKQKWDIILSDYLMPRFSVPAALKIYKESDSDIPFIVISGAIGDKKAVGMMKAGAHDYFLKDNMTRFVSAVERELREAAIRQEKRWAFQNLQIQYALSLKLNKTSDLKLALNYVIETILKVEGIDCSSIYFYNSLTGALELSAYNGLSQDVLKLISQFDAESPFTRFVREGHPIYGQYTLIRQQIDDVPDGEGFLASAIIPIELDGQSIGSIFCASRSADNFLSGTKITLEMIASQISGTIARIQSEEALQKSEREL